MTFKPDDVEFENELLQKVDLLIAVGKVIAIYAARVCGETEKDVEEKIDAENT